MKINYLRYHEQTSRVYFIMLMSRNKTIQTIRNDLKFGQKTMLETKANYQFDYTHPDTNGLVFR